MKLKLFKKCNYIRLATIVWPFPLLLKTSIEISLKLRAIVHAKTFLRSQCNSHNFDKLSQSQELNIEIREDHKELFSNSNFYDRTSKNFFTFLVV